MVKRPVDILPLIHHVKKKAQLQEESGFRMSAASLLNQPPRHSLHCVTLHFWTQSRSFPPSLRDRLWQVGGWWSDGDVRRPRPLWCCYPGTAICRKGQLLGDDSPGPCLPPSCHPHNPHTLTNTQTDTHSSSCALTSSLLHSIIAVDSWKTWIYFLFSAIYLFRLELNCFGNV